MDNHHHHHQQQHQLQQLSNDGWVMPTTTSLSSPPPLATPMYASLPMDMQQQHLSYGTEVNTMMTPITADNGLYPQFGDPSAITTSSSSSMLLTPSVVASEEDYFKPPADINMMREQCSNRMPVVWNGTGMGHDPIMGMIGSASNGCYSDDSLVSPQRTFCLLSSTFASNGSSATPPYDPSCIVTKKQCRHQMSYNNSAGEYIQQSPIMISSGVSNGGDACNNNMASVVATTAATAAPVSTPANSMMHSMTLATSACISSSHTDAEMMSTTTTTSIPQHPLQPTARPMVTPSATIAGPASALPGSTLHNHSNSDIKEALQFRIVLKAPTAATQISDGSPTTYLNRGQSYSIHLQDVYDTDQLITSTFIIMFHEPSHRKVALNYWKFWLGQQKEPSTARVMSLDERQSMGIHNVRYPSFDRITFDWTGSAKLNIRFNCLSTDFSRIKGVKGIPLRAQMETRVVSVEEGGDMYVEQSYCKIKLFRDKGAERKNKDDAKQISRHMERVYGADDAQQQQPIWNTYHQPKPYSEFIRLSTLEDNDNSTIPVEDAPLIDAQERNTRKRSYSQHDSTIASPSTNTNSKTDISLYIHVKTTQHQQFHQGAPSKHHVVLSEATVDELVAQLCPVLSLHHSQVSEVLWRHQQPSKASLNNQQVNKASFPRRNSSNDGNRSHFSAALSVNDDVVAKDFVHGTVLTVEWVIKADGTVRLWLQ